MAAATALTLTGCGATSDRYEPITDGPVAVGWSEDLASCQQLARTRGYWNDDVASEGALAGVVGGVLGGLGDGAEGALAGGLVGATLGAGGRAWDVRGERKAIVVNCMTGRGHAVVG